MDGTRRRRTAVGGAGRGAASQRLGALRGLAVTGAALPSPPADAASLADVGRSRIDPASPSVAAAVAAEMEGVV